MQRQNNIMCNVHMQKCDKCKYEPLQINVKWLQMTDKYKNDPRRHITVK